MEISHLPIAYHQFMRKISGFNKTAKDKRNIIPACIDANPFKATYTNGGACALDPRGRGTRNNDPPGRK